MRMTANWTALVITVAWKGSDSPAMLQVISLNVSLSQATELGLDIPKEIGAVRVELRRDRWSCDGYLSTSPG